MPDVSWVDPLLSHEAFSPTHPLKGRGPLHPGSTWVGVQRSGRNSYEVTVKFDTVDVQSGTVTGTLEIKNLTAELESLVTFFEGDIVGEVGGPGFLTAKYGATEIDDLKHWRRFPAFTRNRLEHQLVKPNLNLRQANNKPFKFLRLKEQFVVGERVEAIHGASYAGFYYCCLDCEPFPPTDPSISPHRGISPATRNVPAFRRRNSSFSRPEPSPSLLTQTRPAIARPSPASPPQPIVNLPSPPRRTVELPTTAEEPTAPRPLPPRRTSSGSISYAAALRGPSGSPASPPLSPTPPSASSFSSSISSASSASPQTPPEHLIRPSAPPPPDLPTPKAELDSSALSYLTEPSSSALPPIIQSVEAGHSSEWPAPTSPPLPTRPPGALRRMSSDVASVLAKAKEKSRGRPGVVRRKSVMEAEDEDGVDDRGMRSWTEATISGFYFHHSASPYQELSLRYYAHTYLDLRPRLERTNPCLLYCPLLVGTVVNP
ncbi:hypothetical protein NBRC10513_004465 [Rhodotorula toruloides]